MMIRALASMAARTQLAELPTPGWDATEHASRPPRIAHAVRRIAIVAPSAASILDMRAKLIAAIADKRHRVLCLVPAAPEEETKAIERLGAECAAYDPDPSSLWFLSVRRAVRQLAATLAEWRAQTVLGYGFRAMPMAALAAEAAGAQRIISLCDGLPSGELHLAEGAVAHRQLRRALGASHALMFHNQDDPQRLAALGLLPPERPVTIVAGAGIDLAAHRAQPLPPLDDGLVFLMRAPLERARGVNDYLRAAAELKALAPTARFLLSGPQGRGAGAISVAQVEKSGAVTYLGDEPDPRPALGLCHVFVYPSHAEGMPVPVLEAMAAGRPILTTRTPGCRETVDEHVNGWLVPPVNVKALKAAMEGYLKRPDLIPPAARASRTKAERQFDEKTALARLLGVLLPT